MFHVLREKSTPPWLVSDWEDATKASSVQCGAEVGRRREAISYEKFQTFLNNNKLHTKQLCKACANKLGIRYKETE